MRPLPVTPRRLLIVQQVFKQYRLAFFQQLAQQLEAEGIELQLCFSAPLAADLAKADNIIQAPAKFATRVPLRTFGPLVWQQLPDLGQFDAVVVEQANRHLVNYFLLLRRCLLPKPKLILWGHGFNHQASESFWSRAKEQYKKCMLNFADGFFAYTEAVAQYALQQGVPAKRITVLNNSLDTREFAASVQRLRRQSLAGASSHPGKTQGFTLLFCGALYPDKKIPLLLSTAAWLAEQKVLKKLIVLGDGPERTLLGSDPARPWLDYRGASFGEDKAAAYAEADVVLHPGLLGLAVLDAFAAGLPLITTDFNGHSPEFAYLTHGKNGLVVQEQALAATVLALLQAPAELAALAEGATQSAAHYSLSAMVQAFTTGVCKVLEHRP